MNTLERIGHHRAMMLRANAAEPYNHDEYKFHEDKCDELLDDLLEYCPQIAGDVKSQYMDVLEYDPHNAVRALTQIINNELEERIANLVEFQASIYWMEEEIYQS